MMSWLEKLGRWALQIAAGLLIALALLVGLARLLLPEAARFADEVRARARAASGFEVDFELLSAGISLYGPELRLAGVTVGWPDGEPIAAAGQIAVAVDLAVLITTGQVVPSQIYIEDVAVAVEVAADGELLVQGRLWSDYLRREETPELPDMRVVLEDIAVDFRDRQRGIEPVSAMVNRADALLDDGQVQLNVDIEPGPALGRSLELEGLVPFALLRDAGSYEGVEAWGLRLMVADFRLDPWLRLMDVQDAPIIGSQGTAEATVGFVGVQPVSVRAELDIERLELLQPEGASVFYDSLAGRVDWSRTNSGWQSSGRELRIERDGRAWPPSEYAIEYRVPVDGTTRIDAKMSFLRANDVMPFLTELAGEQLREAGVTGIVAGDVWNFSGAATLVDGTLQTYSVEADFDKLGYSAADPLLDLAGFSGAVSATDKGGRLNIATTDARLGVGTLFREVLVLDSFEGLALWRAGPEGYRLIANGLQVRTPDGAGTASLELSSDAAFEEPVIDLTAQASMPDTRQATRYLPRKIPDRVIEWLNGAIKSGSAPNAEFRLRGPLRKWPFRDDEGEFSISVDFEDGAVEYGPGWPWVEKASGQLVFLNESMYSTANRFRVGGMNIENADMQIPDLKLGVISLQGGADVPLDKLVSFLQSSPVGEKLGEVFADVRATGQGSGSIAMQIPIKSKDEWRLRGELNLRDGTAWLTTLEPRFADLQGRVEVRNTFVSAAGLAGTLLGEPVRIEVEADADAAAEWSQRAVVTGRLPYAKLEAAVGFPQLGKLAGAADIRAEALFPARGERAEPFRLRVTSDIVGISSDFPYPLDKPAARAEALNAEIRFPERGSIDVDLSLQRGLAATLAYRKEGTRWQLQHGAVGLNMLPPDSAAADALVVAGSIDRIDLEQWTAAFATEGEAGPGAETPELTGGRRWQDLFARIDLDVDELFAIRHRFPNVEIGAAFGQNAWDVELQGPFTAGRVVVPYDFNAETFIELELARLLLTDPLVADPEEDADYALSPLDLPGIRGTVGEFALGDMQLGALEADIVRTPFGLEARMLNTAAPSFSAAVSGDWLVVDNAQRTRMHLEMSSSDMASTLARLGYSPLLSANSGRLVSDLLWEGGPGDAAVYASTGTVDIVIRDGAINEVDPGTGRLLGLVSITSLPRRLSLDFSDMTDEGLVFDKISGRFRLDFGDAWTCNLGLEGEVADMAIVGRTGMAREDYDQVAVVRPHVSNLAPVSAAFLGGPTIGIATLLVAQIFKKPLSGIGESYYTLRGPWHATDIRKVQRGDLDTTAFADCEAQLPELSPEEISAIEEMIAGMLAEQADRQTSEKEQTPTQ